MTTPMSPFTAIPYAISGGQWVVVDPTRHLLPKPVEPMVERTLACPVCRRVFCRVFAQPSAFIDVQCDGCEREGRL